MNIDHHLHRALRRKAAPPDLATRVLTRIEDGRTRPARRAGWPVRWLAAAAAVMVVATGASRYYAYQQTIAEAERVKQDIRLALQITSEKLALAQERVERSADESPR